MILINIKQFRDSAETVQWYSESDIIKEKHESWLLIMSHNDLTFFTNEPDRNLYERFSKILQSNTQFFDILVGYFRTSGFFRMYSAMEQVEKIRVLV